ncbi:MAG TPA: dTDP-4-dehydrorhamnose reductase [Mycobacteriales bacterium]
MRLLVTGAGGQLSTDLMALAPGRAAFGASVAYGIDELDITDAAAVHAAVDAEAAQAGDLVVVNAAAWTDVDGAESHEDEAYAVNAAAAAHLAAACAQAGAPLVHVSTDYVFAGDRPPQGPPYTPEDRPDPQTAYGRTKLAGELAVRELLPDSSWVVRTAWVYGPGKNFVATMARLAAERETVEVVDDQRGSPTWSRDLAAGLLELLEARPPAGTYHATGGGETTWYGLARETFALLGLDRERVRPTTSAAYASRTPRPAYSVLDSGAWAAAGLTPLPRWRDALAEARRTPGAVPGFSRE